MKKAKKQKLKPMGRDKQEKKTSSKKASVVLSELHADVRSLNSSILIISQKMKYLVRNEKILGRNLIVLNKKLKTLEERIASGQVGGSNQAGLSEEASAKIDELNARLNNMDAELSSVKQGTASQEQLQELKYVIDSINPLDFATLQQVKELIDEKTGKKKK